MAYYPKVRLIQTELTNIKNVSHGVINYMNDLNLNQNPFSQETAILGIYGQNGSGKTVVVESLDILKHALSGTPINYSSYAGILKKDGSSCITTELLLVFSDNNYKVSYEVHLKPNTNEKTIELLSERITYWKWDTSWKSERNLSFQNPFYGDLNPLEEHQIQIESNHLSKFQNIPFFMDMQRLALICAQKNISVFFNHPVFANLEKIDDTEDIREFKQVVSGLFQFACDDFHILKTDCHGSSVLTKSDLIEIPEGNYDQVQQDVIALNIALKSIIPNLQCLLKKESESERPDGTKFFQVAVYSQREQEKFSIQYESEGIKKILSVLIHLIHAYNNDTVCVVIDDLDTGIHEYLLGEMVGTFKDYLKGQLIFTANNLRVLEKLDVKNILCTSSNPENRYIRLKGMKAKDNLRNFYIRAITVGGQDEEIYDEENLEPINSTFRKAEKTESTEHSIKFSPQFEQLLNKSEK